MDGLMATSRRGAPGSRLTHSPKYTSLRTQDDATVHLFAWPCSRTTGPWCETARRMQHRRGVRPHSRSLNIPGVLQRRRERPGFSWAAGKPRIPLQDGSLIVMLPGYMVEMDL